jgi:hypothetical protein
MHMLHRRLQILLDEDRFGRVSAEAARRRSSVAAVIRDAIDVALPVDADVRRSAGTAILGAPDMPVPDVEDLRRELDGLRGRHG